MKLMIEGSTLPNLFSNHPPMQIDGNFGTCAGMLEMCLQSHEVEIGDSGKKRRIIRPLPAWPQEWWEVGGRVAGIKARGGFTLNFEWSNDGIGEVRVRSAGREEAILMFPDGVVHSIPLKAVDFAIEQRSDQKIVTCGVAL